MSGELAPLLASGRVQLGLRRGVTPLRRAILLDLTLGLVLLGTHLFYRTILWPTMVVLLLIPIAIAVFANWRRWPSPAATAAWLDEQLRGEGIFTTHHEFVSERRSNGASGALAAFESWTQRTLPRIRERLAALPEIGAARLGALLLLCAALAGTPAWLPGKSAASATETQPRAQAGLSVDTDEPSPRLLAALGKEADASRSTAESTLANTPVRVAGATASVDANESNTGETAGAAASSTQGSSAGSNAASTSTADSVLGRAELHARFRNVAKPESVDAAGTASGVAVQLRASMLAQQAAAFDRETQLLAQQAAAATRNAGAAAGHAGPADNAFTQRFLRLRDDQ